MNISKKTFALSMLGALVLGLLFDFIPEHIAKASLQQKMEQSQTDNHGLQDQMHRTDNQLVLSRFATRSAEVFVEADQNNYSVASSRASSLFTDIRNYVDRSGDQAANAQLTQVLAARDRTIAGLAKADPGVKRVLLEIFEKTQAVSAQAQQ